MKTVCLFLYVLHFVSLCLCLVDCLSHCQYVFVSAFVCLLYDIYVSSVYLSQSVDKLFFPSLSLYVCMSLYLLISLYLYGLLSPSHRLCFCLSHICMSCVCSPLMSVCHVICLSHCLCVSASACLFIYVCLFVCLSPQVCMSCFQHRFSSNL